MVHERPLKRVLSGLGVIHLRAIHKGRPQRWGRGFGQMRTGEGGKGPCGRPQAGTFLYCFSMLCGRSLWMMPIKVQIVIHLIRFAPQSIIGQYILLSG